MEGDRPQYSEAALRALGVFGLTTTDIRGHERVHATRAATAAAQLDAGLLPGQIALVRGPSGTGKSTLLRAALKAIERRAGVAITPPDLGPLRDRRVIDLLAESPGPVPEALRTLAAAGLADAMIPARFVRELSDGQRARLAVALVVRASLGCSSEGHPATILIDEIASTLDDATGQGLCIALARWVRRTEHVRVIAASPRNGAREWLAPDITIDTGGPDHFTFHAHTLPPADRAGPACTDIDITAGDIGDYRALAHLHYRARAPATCVRVLVARTLHHTIGVLTVSMPTLNGCWRRRAWPGEYDGPGLSKRAAADRINRDLRCISRVIIDPRFRARGIGAALVRAYLADPLTRRIEAVAAMGAACPLFVRAGMREWIAEPTWRDIRLIDAIRSAELQPWMIADVAEAAEAAARHPRLAKAFRVWAGKHGSTRSLAHAPIEDVIRAAARSVVARPRAYTAGE